MLRRLVWATTLCALGCDPGGSGDGGGGDTDEEAETPPPGCDDVDTFLNLDENDPAEVGQWGAPIDWSQPDRPAGTGDLLPVHTVHMPSGKLLMWSGGYNQELAADQYLWDIEDDTFEYVPIAADQPRCFFDGVADSFWVECAADGVQDCVDYCESSCWDPDVDCDGNPCEGLSEEDLSCSQAEGTPDIFCAGHTNWIDGSPLIQGGNVTGSLNGSAPHSLFRFAEDIESWEYLGQTPRRRWYPTLTTLHDWRVSLLGGELTLNDKALTLIVGSNSFVVDTNPWGNSGFITYPYMFQMTDGRLFYAGCEGPGSDILFDGQVFNPDTLMWEETYGSSTIPGGSAVMYAPDKVMKSGGCLNGTLRCEAYQATEVIDLTEPSPEWKTSCAMPQPRHFHTLTLLPDGTVLMTGGNREGNGTDQMYCRAPNDGAFTTQTCTSDNDCQMSVFGNETCQEYDNTFYATRSAAIWWPWGGQWIELGEQVHPRMYHSTAALMPDGRVLSAGSGQRTGIPDETEVEFFSPPYEFWGSKPVIESADTSANYGETIEVEVLRDGEPGAAEIHRVTMLRLNSVTHQFDMDQRFIELDFEVTGRRTLNVTMPSDAMQIVPGWTMLFVLTDEDTPQKFKDMASLTGAPNPGIPSVGHYLKLEL